MYSAEKFLRSMSLLLAMWGAGAACSTAPTNRTSEPADDGEAATVVVRSAAGERVAVDGRPHSDVSVGEDFELRAGEHAFSVATRDGGWSEPVVVDLEEGAREEVRVSWEKLATVDRAVQKLAPRSMAEQHRKRAGDPLYGESRLRERATFESAESPSGPYLHIESPRGIVFRSLGFRDGDRLFTVAGEPVESVASLSDRLTAFYESDAGPPEWTLLRDGRKIEVSTEAGDTRPSDSGPYEGARLRVNAKPQGTVVLDGHSTGEQTPADLRVAPGDHEVSVVFDDERESAQREICVSPKASRQLSFEPSTSSSESSSGPKGELTVYAKPKGVIQIDGEPTGETTPGTVEVTAGTHEVRVEFESGPVSEPKTVRVRDDSRIKLFFRRESGGED